MTTQLPALAHAASTSNLALLPSWLDPENIVRSLGPFALVGICLIIFAECGLLVGFFLPGDSLLFVGGMFVASGAIGAPIWLALLLVGLCAFIGNLSGYYIGRAVGPPLFNKPDSKLFKQEYVDKTHEFFERYGGSAVILARFVPIVRTFITAVAGVGRMDPRKFFTYSAIGAILWAPGMMVLGYFLGSITWVKNNIETMSIAIVILSVIPIAVGYLKNRRAKADVTV